MFRLSGKRKVGAPKVLARHLRLLVAHVNLTVEKIASDIRAKPKWLRRLMNEGVSGLDARTEDRFDRLARRFELRQAEDLWDEDAVFAVLRPAPKAAPPPDPLDDLFTRVRGLVKDNALDRDFFMRLLELVRLGMTPPAGARKSRRAFTMDDPGEVHLIDLDEDETPGRLLPHPGLPPKG